VLDGTGFSIAAGRLPLVCCLAIRRVSCGRRCAGGRMPLMAAMRGRVSR